MKILRESTFVDKGAWPRGEWDAEPDKAQWIDDATGLDCLAVRGPVGSWCGYVGVAEGHPAFDKPYDDVEAQVHGGLTFAGFCAENKTERGICHVPEHGRPERVWWLGFDCAHYQDFAPELHADLVASGFRSPDNPTYHVYRNLEYVQGQCAHLAGQLAAMKKEA